MSGVTKHIFNQEVRDILSMWDCEIKTIEISKIDDDEAVDFSMDTSKFKKEVFAIPRLMLTNISITPLYSSISLVLLVLICIV